MEKFGINMNTIELKENKKTARIAGIWYLLFIITAGISQMYLNKIFVADNAVATAQNILATQNQFLLIFFSSIFGHIICFLLLVLGLYRLLKRFDKMQAKLMFSLVLVSVSVMFVFLMFQISALFVLKRAEFFIEFSAEQIAEISTLFLQMRFIGEYVIGIFWGLWLFPLAYLGYKSNFIPKIIVYLLVITGFCHIIDCTLFLISQNLHSLFTDYVLGFGALGEISMMLWLLIKGISTPKTIEK